MTAKSIVNIKQEKQYLRMTLNERIQHFFLLTSFITLVITGFALKFPEALWVRWYADIFGDGAFEFRGDLHRIAAVIMVAVSFYHLVYVSFTKRGRRLVADLWFKKSDITDFIKTIKYYLGRTKEHPRYGRFSYIEKMEYWAVVWGTVIMGATGTVLWFENTFLPVISNSGMDIATAIHYYEAILASLAILVWHLYFVIYNPDVYPMNKAWFTGQLSKEEMELEHPAWLEEIENEETEKKHEEKPAEPETEEEKMKEPGAVTAEQEQNKENKPAEETGKDGSPDEEKIIEEKPGTADKRKPK
jgi:formate dehydrogenase gamma subunit